MAEEILFTLDEHPVFFNFSFLSSDKIDLNLFTLKLVIFKVLTDLKKINNLNYNNLFFSSKDQLLPKGMLKFNSPLLTLQKEIII